MEIFTPVVYNDKTFFYRSKNVEVATFLLKKGDFVEKEKHDGEQILYVLSGTLHIVMKKMSFRIKRGDMCIIKPHTEHFLINKKSKDCKILTFYTPAEHF